MPVLVHGLDSGSAALVAESLLINTGKCRCDAGKVYVGCLYRRQCGALLIYVIFMNKQRTDAAYFSQIRRLAADISIRMLVSYDSPGFYGPVLYPY